MKICLLSAANNTHTMRWANAMSRRGHSVTVVSCKNHEPDSKIIYDKEVKIILLKFSSGLGYYLNANQLKHIVKREKFDVINVHYASGYGTLGRRAKLKNALLNIWGSDVYEFPYFNKFNMKTIKQNLKYFKYVASTSHCMARHAKTLIDREYFITPFGVDTKLFKPLPECRPRDKIIFGTVKTLSPQYGIADTINAFTMLIRRLKSKGDTKTAERLSYEIYGRGELKDKLQKLIDQNGMTEKIKLCGFVQNDKLPEIYNRFTVGNFNSVCMESFGVVALEAMACGIPVQVSDADGFAEVVENGVTGLIAPKGDINAIAENMYQILISTDLQKRMGEAGIDRVKKMYDWQFSVNEMEKIYNQIL